MGAEDTKLHGQSQHLPWSRCSIVVEGRGGRREGGRKQRRREGRKWRSTLNNFQYGHHFHACKQSLYESVVYVTHSFNSSLNHSTSIYSGSALGHLLSQVPATQEWTEESSCLHGAYTLQNPQPPFKVQQAPPSGEMRTSEVHHHALPWYLILPLSPLRMVLVSLTIYSDWFMSVFTGWSLHEGAAVCLSPSAGCWLQESVVGCA